MQLLKLPLVTCRYFLIVALQNLQVPKMNFASEAKMLTDSQENNYEEPSRSNLPKSVNDTLGNGMYNT